MQPRSIRGWGRVGDSVRQAEVYGPMPETGPSVTPLNLGVSR